MEGAVIRVSGEYPALEEIPAQQCSYVYYLVAMEGADIRVSGEYPALEEIPALRSNILHQAGVNKVQPWPSTVWVRNLFLFYERSSCLCN